MTISQSLSILRRIPSNMNDIMSFDVLAYIFVITALGAPGICLIVDYIIKFCRNFIKGYDFESEHKEAVDFRKDK